MPDLPAMPTPPLLSPPMPLTAAIDRLTYEAQYVRDVLFLADGGTCRMSSQSMQRLYDGLAWTLATLRTLQPVPLPAAIPGGTPAAPAAGG